MSNLRRFVQFAFFALVLVAVFLVGANAECWCPFGGVEALATYLAEGNMLCSLGVSNFCILAGILVMTLLVRRVFCSYMCPIGAVSEWIHAVGRRFGVRGVPVSRRADHFLSLLKYVLLALILWFTWRAGELIFRGFDPCYALISRHGADITFWAYVVAAAVAAASVLIMVPFCRWLCPFAAVLNPFSRIAITRIQRDATTCNGCRRCAVACPMSIPVNELAQVNVARCTSCLSCVESCPTGNLGTLQCRTAWTGTRVGPSVLIAVLLFCTSGAVGATYLFPLPSFVKTGRTEPPDRIASVSLRVNNLTCRGRANLLVWFLERDDLYRVPASSGDGPGYFKLEAWPNPGIADVRISYDPEACDKERIQQAITEPYYDVATERWWASPFTIEGYDPLGP